jgi:hypothetical protein
VQWTRINQEFDFLLVTLSTMQMIERHQLDAEARWTSVWSCATICVWCAFHALGYCATTA